MKVSNNTYKRLENVFVEQHDSADCGVACLLMIIRYHGGDSSILHLREISGTFNTGTTLLGLYQAARKVGFDANGCQLDNIDELKRINNPCILFVHTHNLFAHYVVCFGFKNNRFIIGDPNHGITGMTEDELYAIWTMKCLQLEPTCAFELKEAIKDKKKTWILDIVRDDYGLLFSCLFLGLITTVLGMAMTLFSQKLIDNILPEKDAQKLAIGICAIFVISTINLLLSAIRGKLLLQQCRDFNNRITKFFLNKLLHLPKIYFDSRKIGDILSRLGDTNRIQSVISSFISNTLICILIIIVYTFFLFTFSWQIGILTVLCSPIYFWIIAKHNKLIIHQQRDVMNSSAICNSGFINMINGIADIKSFSRQDSFLDKNYELYANCQDKIYALGQTNIKIGIEAGLNSTIIQTGLIAVCSVLVLKDTMTIGVLMAVISISSTIFSTVSGLASIMIPINEAKVAFQRMYEFVYTEEENEKNISVNKLMDVKAQKLTLTNLSFRYVGRQLLLNNISLEFEKGTITSIVGESGCGKSTLCQIIERFYKPETGNIFIDGTDISHIPISEWCKIVSFVPQDIFLYNGTVLDNICFGKSGDSFEDIFKFCEHYGFITYFRELPNNIFTLVGEDGINLSGGQKQLVAFARALYRPFDVLVLDEMTAAMDRRTERFICDLLMKLKQNHIIIFVTHRLETARLISDRIVVMDNGRITQNGNHKELLCSDNFYSQFWKDFQ